VSLVLWVKQKILTQRTKDTEGAHVSHEEYKDTEESRSGIEPMRVRNAQN
jgi:hypothetical protein